jgi:hypothetical protein
VTDNDHTIKYDEPAVEFQARLLMQNIGSQFSDWMADSVKSRVPPPIRCAAATYVFATLIATLAHYSVDPENYNDFIDLICRNVASAAKEAQTPERPNERPN